MFDHNDQVGMVYIFTISIEYMQITGIIMIPESKTYLSDLDEYTKMKL